MDEDFDRNLSGFTLSVLYAACSESEADTLFDLQTKTDDTDKTTLETNKEREETASEEERATVFGSLRNTELDRLTKAISKTRNEKNASNTDAQTNKGDVEEINTEKDTDTASEEERAAFFRSVRSNELDRLTADKGAAKEINTEMDIETASEEERAPIFRSVRSNELDRLTVDKRAAKEINTEMDIETASEEERAAFFRSVRNNELDRLTVDKGAAKEINTEMDIETASEEERAAFFKSVRSKELDRLTATLDKQNDEAGNQDVQTEPNIPKIINTEGFQNQGETEALDTEETANEEDRLAFFQSVRDSERKKLVEAFERDTIWKEEREKKRMKKRQEQIKKMFEEFHKPAVSALSASYSSPEQEPGPYNEHYHQYPSNSNTEYNILLKASVSKLHERVQAFVEEQKELQLNFEQAHSKKPTADLDENKENRHISIRASSDAEIILENRINKVKRTGSVRRFVNRIFQRSKSTTADLETKQIDPDGLKLDLTLLDDNKDEDHAEEDYLDTARTSNSEWYTFSDIEDPPRPTLKPFFTSLKESHETTRAHIPGSTNPKAAESVNPFLLNEPTKSVPIKIPDRKHSDFTFEYSLNSAGRFHRFRKWFKRLCRCCSQNAEDSETVCS